MTDCDLPPIPDRLGCWSFRQWKYPGISSELTNFSQTNSLISGEDQNSNTITYALFVRKGLLISCVYLLRAGGLTYQTIFWYGYIDVHRNIFATVITAFLFMALIGDQDIRLFVLESGRPMTYGLATEQWTSLLLQLDVLGPSVRVD